MKKVADMTDQEVDEEIARLKASVFVKLSAAEQRARVARKRKQLYYLQHQERRGMELAALGVTRETVKAFVAASVAEESED